MDSRAIAAPTLDQQLTSCLQASGAGVMTEEAVMSLSFFNALRRMLCQASPAGGRKGSFSFLRKTLTETICVTAAGERGAPLLHCPLW